MCTQRTSVRKKFPHTYWKKYFKLNMLVRSTWLIYCNVDWKTKQNYCKKYSYYWKYWEFLFMFFSLRTTFSSLFSFFHVFSHTHTLFLYPKHEMRVAEDPFIWVVNLQSFIKHYSSQEFISVPFLNINLRDENIQLFRHSYYHPKYFDNYVISNAVTDHWKHLSKNLTVN